MKPLNMQTSIIWYLSQGQDKLGGLRQGHSAWKWDDGGGGIDSLDGLASRWIVGVSASVIFLCTMKFRRWQAVMEEVDKGCSEFCVTVGTATRTVSILIYRWLKALAVNLSWPSGWLLLYAGLFGSANPRWLTADIVVCANPSSLWVWVGECFFWYWLTWVVPDKGPLNGYVCVIFANHGLFL